MGLRAYAAIAVLVAILLGLGGCYVKGRLDASHAAEKQALEDTIADLNDAAERERNARRLDTIQAKLDREDADALETKVKELEDALENADAVCFGAADADRLRDAAP